MFRKLQRLSKGRVALRKGDIPKVREGCGPTHYSEEGQLVHLLRSMCTDT